VLIVSGVSVVVPVVAVVTVVMLAGWMLLRLVVGMSRV
jgi:hypothetical protein